MSIVSSCTLLSGVPAALPANPSAGSRLQFRRPAAVAPLSLRGRPRPLSVCCGTGKEHNPKTELHSFNIPPYILVHPVSPGEEERWHLKEEAEKVSLRFEVPGQSTEDLAVEIDEDVLVIRKKTNGGFGGGAGGAGMGQRTTPAAGGKDSKAAAQDEAPIYARLLLPAGYSKEGVQAELTSGVLTVSIARVNEKARRRIPVEIKLNNK
ncbi:hypothetical protein ACP4OV_019244 [Aristida adscensionis]